MGFVAKDSENRVAEALGITRAEVRSARKNLAQGSDWEFVDRVVMYSEAGIERLMNDIGIKGGSVSIEKNAALDEGTASGGKPASDMGEGAGRSPALIVCGISRICPNPTWVFAAFEKNNKRHQIQVRVQNNRVMRIGMVISAIPHPGAMGEKNIWLMIGGKVCR